MKTIGYKKREYWQVRLITVKDLFTFFGSDIYHRNRMGWNTLKFKRKRLY